MTNLNNQLSKYCFRNWVFYIGNCLDQLGQLDLPAAAGCCRLGFFGLKPCGIGYHLFSAINDGTNDMIKHDSIAPSFMTGKELPTKLGLFP